ncbi:diguanylate cyclase [Vibrio hannami]|uniref:diguanylate cyclase n=1 Tax=Vibrio hannami TaxID=2717094 RepID=UPI00240F3189|nr:diguanylate cyclase [Vibrio hannami]MDG3086022.1 diguanylate cyclase [Vibrio hannami]
MKLLKRTFFALLVISLNSPASAQEIRVMEAKDPRNALALSVLELALSKVDKSLTTTQVDDTDNEARNISEVEAGNLDVMWAGAAQEKDERLMAVRIPILKGMLGHRIFIIRNGDQYRFDNINSLNDLKTLNAGQGTFWGDTRVLKAAGIPTLTTIKYPNLFKMLEGERFDYFPRAVHEPWPEVASRPELNLTVEKNLMLIYPFAMFFYVNKSDHELYDKIYRGFEMAIKDGSFDELFFNNPSIKDVLEKANMGGRKIFRIDNPYMHPDTPFDRKEFWLDISQL